MAKETDEIKVIKEKATKLGIPFIDLSGKTISPEVLKEIPEEAASFYQFIPFEKEGNKLKVGLVNPDDLQAQEALRFIALRSELSPEIYIITSTDFAEGIRQYRTIKEEVSKALKELERELAKEEKPEIKREEVLERMVAEAPITKIVAVILGYAQEGGASDIHIEPYEKELKVRFRVDGILHTSLLLPENIHSAIISRIKILANLKIDETRIPQDGRFRATIANKKIDFRVSVLPTMQGEKAAMRLLDPSIGLMGFEELGLISHNLEVLKKGISQPFGMILLTGPTGCGKTTTLYAILKELNREGVNIISLEDPVEYYIEGVNQSQTRPEIGYSFASGLRSILRQDPDIIMVGEIRDKETAGLAVHTALTGHILLSTLHTNNAIGIIPRLIDMDIEPFLIPASLNLGIAQRLVRRLCQNCKKEVKPLPKINEMLEKELANLSEKVLEDFKIQKPFKLYQSSGCRFCNKKGTKGRVAIFEVLSMTKELEKITLEGPSESNIIKEAERQGMITMKQDGILKALQGIVSLEEVLKVTEE